MRGRKGRRVARPRRLLSSEECWELIRRVRDALKGYVTQARAAEQREVGHECGHVWEITVRGRGHTWSDTSTHSDNQRWDNYNSVQVRAHDLPTAFLIASTLPVSDWTE